MSEMFCYQCEQAVGGTGCTTSGACGKNPDVSNKQDELVCALIGLAQVGGGKDTEKAFVRMLITRRHLSVLEHAYATLRISGVSRAFTHQLVRHRLCSYTQQSQRYVNESNFHYVEPPLIEDNPEAHSAFTKFMDEAKRVYLEL